MGTGMGTGMGKIFGPSYIVIAVPSIKMTVNAISDKTVDIAQDGPVFKIFKFNFH